MVPRIPARFRPRGIDFLYEDADVVVIVKAEGILAVPTRKRESFTAESAVTNYLRRGQARSPKHAYVVHRLDRETSGVMLFAKSEEAQERIKDNWSANEKIYLALVRGRPDPERGLLEHALVEDEDLFVRVARNPREGKPCRLEYETLASGEGISLVRVHLLTGRKNQIRVQFAAVGNPVVGDAKYGRDSPRERRLYLHAAHLAFDQPTTKARLSFDASLPESFQRRCRGLLKTANITRYEDLKNGLSR